MSAEFMCWLNISLYDTPTHTTSYIFRLGLEKMLVHFSQYVCDGSGTEDAEENNLRTKQGREKDNDWASQVLLLLYEIKAKTSTEQQHSIKSQDQRSSKNILVDQDLCVRRVYWELV